MQVLPIMKLEDNVAIAKSLRASYYQCLFAFECSNVHGIALTMDFVQWLACGRDIDMPNRDNNLDNSNSSPRNHKTWLVGETCTGAPSWMAYLDDDDKQYFFHPHIMVSTYHPPLGKLVALVALFLCLQCVLTVPACACGRVG